MEYFCIAQELLIQFVGPEQRVRPRIAYEGELPLAAVAQRDEGKACGRGRVHDEALRIDSRPLCCGLQKAAVHIVAHLAYKGGGKPLLCRCRKEVGRCAAGVLLKERVARRGKTSLSKVHQKLAKSGNICHIKTVPFEYNRVESSNYTIFLCDLARRLIKTRDCVIIQRRIYSEDVNAACS